VSVELAARLRGHLADPRVVVRNAAGVHTEGACVVYWMQRAQRATDNPALDLAIRAGNELQKPVVVLVVVARGARARSALARATRPPRGR
jgi:hypothetical protein